MRNPLAGVRLRAVSVVCAALLGTGLAVPGAGAAWGAEPAAAPVGQGFTLTPSDLAFILRQIKIAERHADTLSPSNPCGTLVGPGPDQIPDRLSSFGLRTVDGSCNNLFAGREAFGTADRVFPRLSTAPDFRSAEPITASFPVGAPGPTSYEQRSGAVIDSQPRVISNLIDDQTSTNPAAVAAAGFPVRAQPGAPRTVACTTDPDPAAVPPVLAEPAGCVPSHQTLFIPNVTTDVGLSPPYNSLFTFFGQFFDHGLDQTVKGGGTVFVPLQPDDPLVTLGPDGKPGSGDEVPPSQAFMVLTRAQNQPGPDHVLGTADDVRDASNTDSPWADQSQTYTSHPSHQVFLREYALSSADRPVSTGRMLGGLPAGLTYRGSPDGRSGMATWAAVKEQARTLLGLALVDRDVTSVPMLATDPYGRFIPGPARGLPQYVTKTGLVEGNLAAPVPVPSNVLRFDTPFLTDIAHNADPSPQDSDNNPATPPVVPAPDADDTPSADFTHQPAGTYDDEMLAAHFACGDGRCNENIALSAIHQIFHSEHNRLVADIEQTLLADTSPSGKAALADWQQAENPTGWNGERIFQAARFVNEMEYQHLVFEEFARKVAPAIPVFDGYSPDIDPAISAEFAQAVYRFGHSMLDETVARSNVDPVTGAASDNSIPLLTAFLNPPEYFDGGAAGTLSPERAAGAIVMGSSDQVGNELDEFVTETLRNNLLGLPLDLAAINMTRARETGIPRLNEFRSQLSELTNDGALEPYSSWADFGQHLKHPESLVNFVAAYGKHPSITGATTLAAKRAAAQLIVDPAPGAPVPDDAADFMLGTGAWDVSGGGTITGLEDVDLWVGGLAEATNVNGGLLGSTFNYVFERQLTDLQDGDRLYYLNRTAGMNLLAQLEGNSFAEMIQRNTQGTHALKGDAFATADCRFELGHLDGSPQGFATDGSTVHDDPTSECDESKLLLRAPDGTIAYRATNTVDPSGVNGQSVYDGTPGVDRVTGGSDSDTFWGGAGKDVIEGNGGDDVAVGGEGADIVTDASGADTLRGGPGNDALDAGPGNDLVLGGDGADFTNGGGNDNQTFAGPGDDYVIAGGGGDVAQGDGGDDWIEGGAGRDTLVGDHGAPYFDDPGQVAPGNDVLVGQPGDNGYDAEGGDDVMSAHPGVDSFGGFGGYDWAIHQFDTVGADDDMLVNQNQFGQSPSVVNRDVWQETEAISGSARDDVLRGDDTVPREAGGVGFTGCDVLDQTGVDRIAGLATLLPQPLTEDAGPVVARAKPGGCPLSGPVWGEGNILLGGPGSDTLEGRGGNDVLDGDRAMSVHISVRTDPADPGTETGWTDLMEHQATNGTFGPGTAGMTLQQAVFAGLVDPGNLTIVRQIDTPAAASTAGDTDVAVFEDVQANYDCTTAGVTAPCGTTSDGSTTLVVHARGSGTDGTDTLRNIERLEFSNGVPPGAPTIGEVVAGDRAATVSWTAPPGPVTGFSLETWAADGTVGVLHSAAGTARTLTIPGLTNGTAYRFRVRALKGALSSPFSAMSAPVTPSAPAGPTPSPSSTPSPSATATPTAPAPATGAADSVALISTLTSRQSCVRCPAALRGSVAPFQGVTLALEQQMPDGTFRTVTEQVISGSAASGRFSFSLDTATSGWSSYRVVVSGAGVRTTAGPVRTLGVFRTRIVDVSPRGREFVALRNSGTIVTQLEGWRLRDRSGRSLTLPQLALAPGATVRVYTGSGRQTRHRVFLGRAADIWASGHDIVRLRDSRDRPITSRRY